MKKKCAVFAGCLPFPPYKKEEKKTTKKNGHCSFKKLNCPLGPAERRDWWASAVPLGDELETGAAPRCVWELWACLASIQKSSGALSTERLGRAV